MRHLLTPTLKVQDEGETGALVLEKHGRLWRGVEAPKRARKLASEVLRLASALSLAERLESLAVGRFLDDDRTGSAIYRRPEAAGGGFLIWQAGATVAADPAPTSAAAAARIAHGIPPRVDPLETLRTTLHSRPTTYGHPDDVGEDPHPYGVHHPLVDTGG